MILTYFNIEVPIMFLVFLYCLYYYIKKKFIEEELLKYNRFKL